MSSISLARPRQLAISSGWGVALPALLAAMAAGASALRPAIDPDLGWHLRTGQLILANRAVPHADPFSHTRFGAPWVDNEWLWEATMAAIHGAAGTLALVFLNAALLALAATLIYVTLRVRRLPQLWAAVGTCLAVIALIPYTDVRPGMVGVLCMAAMVLLLEKHRASGNWPPLLLLPLAEALWANCHGSYVIGFGLCGIYALGSLWQGRRWRLALPWAAVEAGLLGASLLNPIGYGLIRFTVGASRLKFNREFVHAWQAPNFHDTAVLPLLAIVVASLAIPMLWPEARLPKTEALLLLVATVAALQSNEFLPLYAVVAAPLLAQLGAGCLSRAQDWRPSGLQAAALLAATCSLALLPVRLLTPSAYAQSIDQKFPTEAVAFIERQQLSGPLWNEFDWGGYLIDALPRMPVLVDSRTEMYGDDFLREYIDVDGGREPAAQAMDRYGIRLVLVRPNSTIAAELRASTAWKQRYADKLAAIFTRVER